MEWVQLSYDRVQEWPFFLKKKRDELSGYNIREFLYQLKKQKQKLTNTEKRFTKSCGLRTDSKVFAVQDL